MGARWVGASMHDAAGELPVMTMACALQYILNPHNMQHGFHTTPSTRTLMNPVQAQMHALTCSS